VKNEDRIEKDNIHQDNVVGSYYLLHRLYHKWRYLSNQREDEMSIFLTWDDDEEGDEVGKTDVLILFSLLTSCSLSQPAHLIVLSQTHWYLKILPQGRVSRLDLLLSQRGTSFENHSAKNIQLRT
jgi:hypothetical protein